MTTASHEPTGARAPSLRLLLIGTGRTCDQILAQLGSMSDPPAVAGCVSCDGRGPASAGAAVLGSIDELPRVLSSLDHAATVAVVCLPARLRAVTLRALSALERAALAVRVVPAIEDVLTGDQAVDTVRRAPLDYSRLIGRTPYGIDRRAVGRLIEGRRVLITGAGGSIGSEIAQIVATFSPASLVLMERSENALFEINRRIGERFPSIHRSAILHDVIDAPGTLRHLTALRPDVVFHAAAHKHVPLMEDHPYHAVANNFFGTKSIADAAVACGATRFVLISSDKAVKPTSVMGATKRLAEMYVQALHRSIWARRRASADTASPAASLCMVRFGNVLGSACSVLPIWSSQLADGGPITVTDARMTRYFMTIQEAASLVIQAGAIETSDPTARVYVLDMGAPVRILDLAREFVRASGFAPVVSGAEGSTAGLAEMLDTHGSPEMEIRLTGARPGEKLHEELAYAAELLQPTPYPGINAWAGPLGDDFSLTSLVSDLASLSTTTDRSTVLDVIRRHVPELPNLASAPGQEPKRASQTGQSTVRGANEAIVAA